MLTTDLKNSDLSETELLNLNTIRQLLQVEAKIPNFYHEQTEKFFLNWATVKPTLENHLVSGNFTQAADCLHKIKGHSGMIGFTAIQKLAGEAEKALKKSTQVSNGNRWTDVVKDLEETISHSMKAIEGIIAK